MTLVTEQFVIDALNSSEAFPIDFDDTWKPMGYSTKQKALQRLESTHDEGIDFLTRRLKSSTGGRRSQKIVLTLEAFKSFCMVAETPQGREVRNYFIEVEKTYRKNLELQFKQPTQGYVRNDFNLVKQLEDKTETLELEVKRLLVQVEKLTDENTKLQSILSTAKRKLEIAERNQRSGKWGDDITEHSNDFIYDADYLFLISGIASSSYFIAKLYENFKLSEDFIKERYAKSKHGDFSLGRDKYFCDADTALATVINHRSKAGTSKRELPEMYHHLFDQVTQGNNTNRRHLRAR